MVDIEKLKALAENAAKIGENWIAAGMFRQLFASSATPELVLELIAELQRYEMLYRQSEKTLDRVHCMWAKCLLDATGERQAVLIPDEEFVKYFEELKQVKAENQLLATRVRGNDIDYYLICKERDQLKEELAKLADLKAYITIPLRERCAQRLELQAENESLRNNATRYEWLRNEHTRPGCLSSDPDKAKWLDEYLMCGDKLDAAIDEQLAK